MRSFADRVAAISGASGALSVGIDPHESLLEAWGLTVDAAGVREFGLRVVEAARGRVGVVKPQVAFFERYGSAGYAALEEVLAAAREAGLLVIADVKRGDIDFSVDAYGAAWLTPGSPLEVDAMTAVAYQGVGSLERVLERAERGGKGVFVLAATSNPEALDVQSAHVASGGTVARRIVAECLPHRGSVGVVVGATVDLASVGLDLDVLSDLPILAPGYGAQGARLSDVGVMFARCAPQVLAHVSRSVLAAGPVDLPDAIDAARHELARGAAT